LADDFYRDVGWCGRRSLTVGSSIRGHEANEEYDDTDEWSKVKSDLPWPDKGTILVDHKVAISVGRQRGSQY
jgi:hypothetical protein